MNIIFFWLLIIYLVGVVACMMRISKFADKHKIDDAFFAIGSLLVSFSSWIGFFLFIKKFEND
jgi:hypothetical protein